MFQNFKKNTEFANKLPNLKCVIKNQMCVLKTVFVFQNTNVVINEIRFSFQNLIKPYSDFKIRICVYKTKCVFQNTHLKIPGRDVEDIECTFCGSFLELAVEIYYHERNA